MGRQAKASYGKGSVSNARVGKTHTPSATSGKGSGATKRDSAKATGTPSGGSTLRIRSGDVKVTTGSNAKYK